MAPISNWRNLPVVQAFPSCYRPKSCTLVLSKASLLPISRYGVLRLWNNPKPKPVKPDACGFHFSEEAFAQVVSAHGALIVMKQIVFARTQLHIKNKNQRRNWFDRRRLW